MSSEVILESHGSRSALEPETHPYGHAETPAISQTPFDRPSIHLRIQRTQLVLASLVVVAIIAVIMWFCADDGVILETFESTDKDEPTRKKLLDKYNSISGNVVSVFIKPLEYFVAVVLALALLCFATEFALSSHTTRYNYVLLALVAATGYLLSTGFNAINVQLAPQPIDAVVSAQDLSLSAVGDTILGRDSKEQKLSSLVADLSNRTLLEEDVDNPITNTVFRNWALSLDKTPVADKCNHINHLDELLDFSAFYNIPGRAWFSDAMPVALKPSKHLKFVTESPSFKARVVPVPGADSSKPELPMSRSRAMALLVDAIHNAGRIFLATNESDPISPTLFQAATSAFKRHFDNKNMFADESFPAISDVLLSDARAASGSAFSDADVIQAMANLSAPAFTSNGVRGPKIEVDLTHFDLSDNLTFDAVTVEFPSQKGFLQQRLVVDETTELGYSVVRSNSASANSTGDQYFELDAFTNCSLNACVIYDRSTKANPQIFAYPMCVDDPEYDALRFRYDYLGSDDDVTGQILCTNTSNTSLTVVSFGVRIEGEEMVYATIGSGSNTREIVRLKNARKVVSITVGRLSWETVDLAAVYGAVCAGKDTSMCEGVRYKLAHSKGSKRRHVLASSKRLPVSGLPSYYYNTDNYIPSQGRTLVKLLVVDSTRWDDGKAVYMVMPRRFNRSSVPKNSDDNDTLCSKDVDSFVLHMEMNHLYIEKSLQPAYAAAVFFLFQDGVLLDEAVDSSTTSEGGAVAGTSGTKIATSTLAFLGNRQRVDVRLSSPMLNIVTTLVGCSFLLLLAVAVAATSKTSVKRLERLADAHNTVEMLVDTSKYPPLLLKKTISSSCDVAGEREYHDSATTSDHQVVTNNGGTLKHDRQIDTGRTEPLDENVRVQRVALTRHDGANNFEGAAGSVAV